MKKKVNMRDLFIKIIVMNFVIVSSSYVFAQTEKKPNADDLMKEGIFLRNKSKVLNYSMKDFEKLFFEFSEKKYDSNIILSKEEFYNYTVKIGIFSDRLVALYPAEKEIAEESKKRWLAENYEEYLMSKKTEKK